MFALNGLEYLGRGFARINDLGGVSKTLLFRFQFAQPECENLFGCMIDHFAAEQPPKSAAAKSKTLIRTGQTFGLEPRRKLAEFSDGLGIGALEFRKNLRFLSFSCRRGEVLFQKCGGTFGNLDGGLDERSRQDGPQILTR